MKPHQIVRQIKFLFYTIALVLLIFGAIALYYVTAHGKAYEVGLSYESNLRALLLILALAGIPASFIFHSQKVKHIDKALGAGIKLQQYRTSYFIKIITLEGLSLLSLLAFITTAQLNYLSIFGILYLAQVISFPRKLTILDELEIDPSDVTTHTQHS